MVVSWRKRTLAVVAVVALGGCAADSGDDTGFNGVGGGPSASALVIAFSPMYSANDGIHSFKIPAIVQNVMADSWSVEPADAADLSQDVGNGGIMITTRKPGDFKVIAKAGKLRGEAELHVTAATPDEWTVGEARYKNNVMITAPAPMMGMMGPPMLNIPDNAACGNCHGQGGTMLNVEHTPQQIGGYSDDQLITIFTTGTKPAGSPFRSMIPPFFYKMFHTWETADESEARALVVYLRSLEPKAQEGISFRRPGSGPAQ